MNVLQINYSDIAGGAAIAGYRLHQGLLTQGVSSKLLVGWAKTKSDRVASLPQNPITKEAYRLTWRLGLNYLHIVDTFNIPKHPFYQEADVLNFHILHSGYFNYLAIPQLTKPKPAIWTLHDMWSFTGHCGYSYDCDRWKTGCGKCPYPQEYPAIGIDNTHVEWKLKEWIYRRSNLIIVSPSQWLAETARQSMLNSFPIHHIPNGIDTELYQPFDPHQCRSLLGIPPNRKVLAFVAQSLAQSRKGGDLLLDALARLPDSLKAETLLLTLGEGGHAMSQVGIDTIDLGYVSHDRLKAIAYSAADLFVFPTRADNLPLVLQESMACGTPMVSFKLGGVPELVRPGQTGYLAEPGNAQDLCDGIVKLLEDDVLREQMRQTCRTIALEEYSLPLQVQRYCELYEQAFKA